MVLLLLWFLHAALAYDYVSLRIYSDSNCNTMTRVQTYYGGVCQPTSDPRVPGGYERFYCTNTGTSGFDSISAEIYATPNCNGPVTKLNRTLTYPNQCTLYGGIGYVRHTCQSTTVSFGVLTEYIYQDPNCEGISPLGEVREPQCKLPVLGSTQCYYDSSGSVYTYRNVCREFGYVSIALYSDSSCTTMTQVSNYDGASCQPTFDSRRPGGWERFYCAGSTDGTGRDVIVATIYSGSTCVGAFDTFSRSLSAPNTCTLVSPGVYSRLTCQAAAINFGIKVQDIYPASNCGGLTTIGSVRRATCPTNPGSTGCTAVTGTPFSVKDACPAYQWIVQATYADSQCSQLVSVRNYQGSACQPTFDTRVPGGWENFYCVPSTTPGYDMIAANIYSGPSCTGTFQTLTRTLYPNTCSLVNGVYSRMVCSATPNMSFIRTQMVYPATNCSGLGSVAIGEVREPACMWNKIGVCSPASPFSTLPACPTNDYLTITQFSDISCTNIVRVTNIKGKMCQPTPDGKSWQIFSCAGLSVDGRQDLIQADIYSNPYCTGTYRTVIKTNDFGSNKCSAAGAGRYTTVTCQPRPLTWFGTKVQNLVPVRDCGRAIASVFGEERRPTCEGRSMVCATGAEAGPGASVQDVCESGEQCRETSPALAISRTIAARAMPVYQQNIATVAAFWSYSLGLFNQTNIPNIHLTPIVSYGFEPSDDAIMFVQCAAAPGRCGGSRVGYRGGVASRTIFGDTKLRWYDFNRFNPVGSPLSSVGNAFSPSAVAGWDTVGWSGPFKSEEGNSAQNIVGTASNGGAGGRVVYSVLRYYTDPCGGCLDLATDITYVNTLASIPGPITSINSPLDLTTTTPITLIANQLYEAATKTPTGDSSFKDYLVGLYVGYSNDESYFISDCRTYENNVEPRCSGKNDYVFGVSNPRYNGWPNRTWYAYNPTSRAIGARIWIEPTIYITTQRPWYTLGDGWTDTYPSVRLIGNVRTYTKRITQSNGWVAVLASDRYDRAACTQIDPLRCKGYSYAEPAAAYIAQSYTTRSKTTNFGTLGDVLAYAQVLVASSKSTFLGLVAIGWTNGELIYLSSCINIETYRLNIPACNSTTSKYLVLVSSTTLFNDNKLHFFPWDGSTYLGSQVFVTATNYVPGDRLWYQLKNGWTMGLVYSNGTVSGNFVSSYNLESYLWNGNGVFAASFAGAVTGGIPGVAAAFSYDEDCFSRGYQWLPPVVKPPPKPYPPPYPVPAPTPEPAVVPAPVPEPEGVQNPGVRVASIVLACLTAGLFVLVLIAVVYFASTGGGGHGHQDHYTTL